MVSTLNNKRIRTACMQMHS